MADTNQPTKRTVADDRVHPDPISSSMSVTEVTALVQLFNNQLLAMEGRLVAKMDDSVASAAERWVRHDAELETNTKRVIARFEKIEASMLVTEQALKAHLDREHDEQVAIDARVRPVKNVFGWVWDHWRDIVLLFIGIAALMTFLVESFGRILGPHAP